MTPTECQTICQLREGCGYWSHWIELQEEHIGHCELHFSCPYLENQKCLSEEDPRCPTIPNAAPDHNIIAKHGDYAHKETDLPAGPGDEGCAVFQGRPTQILTSVTYEPPESGVIGRPQQP